MADEVTKGYDPKRYPSNEHSSEGGAYFATDKALARDFQSRWQNGLQEINIPRSTFDEMVQKGIIKRDGAYNHIYGDTKGGSWYVPADKLTEFNDIITKLPNNRFHPQN